MQLKCPCCDACSVVPALNVNFLSFLRRFLSLITQALAQANPLLRFCSFKSTETNSLEHTNLKPYF